MKLKFVAVAALTLAASFGTQAGGAALGTLAVPSSTSFSEAVTGAFSDSWTFNTLVPSFGTGSATNTSFTIFATTYGLISGFAGTLDGNLLTWSTASANIGPGVQTTNSLLSTPPIFLAAGAHTLTLAGSTDSNGAQLSGSISLSPAPVPEPETYALFLAGLGVLGFMAKRRR